jgi:hypothetical protein
MQFIKEFIKIMSKIIPLFDLKLIKVALDSLLAVQLVIFAVLYS